MLTPPLFTTAPQPQVWYGAPPLFFFFTLLGSLQATSPSPTSLRQRHASPSPGELLPPPFFFFFFFTFLASLQATPPSPTSLRQRCASTSPGEPPPLFLSSFSHPASLQATLP